MHLLRNVIKEYAKSKNIAFTEQLPQSFTRYYDEKIDQYNSQTVYDYYIGIELKPNAMYWFKAYVNDINSLDNEYLFFEHRYNCNTGTSIKGFRTGQKAKEMILNN